MTNPYSPQQWMQLNIQQQGLLKPAKSVVDVITQLSYVQIDSINVVERAHHHVLHNRISQYQPAFLDDAMANKQVFEYWSHAAAFLPIEDYRFSLYRKQHLLKGGKHWFEPNHQAMREVKARITAEGPLKANQFVNSNESSNGAWWDWKPAKKALEQLFMQGDLMISKRDKFQKVYDLAERVLPANIDTQVPSDEEFAEHLINRYLLANACGTQAQIMYLRKGIKPLLNKVLANMCEQGDIVQFTHFDQMYYRLPNHTLPHSIPNKVWLLNPFDNLVIQRQRLKQWFGFDYQIEVYVPEAKRQFGYYSLPILWGERFVGRVDVKADRNNQCLLLQNIHFEDKAFDSKLGQRYDRDKFIPAFIDATEQYAKFNGCQYWQLVRCNDAYVSQALAKASNQ